MLTLQHASLPLHTSCSHCLALSLSHTHLHTLRVRAQAVDVLCRVFTASDKQLLFLAHHGLSGKVLVRAVAIAMPRQPALTLATKVASHAAALITTPGGQFTLLELLQLYGHNQEAAEGLRDVVTTMAYSLQGQLGR